MHQQDERMSCNDNELEVVTLERMFLVFSMCVKVAAILEFDAQ